MLEVLLSGRFSTGRNNQSLICRLIDIDSFETSEVTPPVPIVVLDALCLNFRSSLSVQRRFGTASVAAEGTGAFPMQSRSTRTVVHGCHVTRCWPQFAP